jgi:glycosyltransferase involved in cell wall biosynthesis
MKISIVTPCYNSSTYIEQTIQSILKQSYQNFEHIIIDGQSSDGTLEILKKYPHLNWISEKDSGQSNAINKGFQKATGDILAWQNADDIYCLNTFEWVIDFFKTHPDVDVVYGNYQLINSEGEFICNVRAVDWDLWLFKHGRLVPMQPTVFWRRKVYESVGDLNENLNYCMDVDFFCRAAKHFKFAKLDKTLGQFRVHQISKTQNTQNKSKVYQEHKQILRDRFNYSPINSLIFDLFYYRGRLARIIKIRK